MKYFNSIQKLIERDDKIDQNPLLLIIKSNCMRARFVEVFKDIKLHHFKINVKTHSRLLWELVTEDPAEGALVFHRFYTAVGTCTRKFKITKETEVYLSIFEEIIALLSQSLHEQSQQHTNSNQPGEDGILLFNQQMLGMACELCMCKHSRSRLVGFRLLFSLLNNLNLEGNCEDYEKECLEGVIEAVAAMMIDRTTTWRTNGIKCSSYLNFHREDIAKPLQMVSLLHANIMMEDTNAHIQNLSLMNARIDHITLPVIVALFCTRDLAAQKSIIERLTLNRVPLQELGLSNFYKLVYECYSTRGGKCTSLKNLLCHYIYSLFRDPFEDEELGSTHLTFCSMIEFAQPNLLMQNPSLFVCFFKMVRRMARLNAERNREFEVYLRETCRQFRQRKACTDEVLYLRVGCSIKSYEYQAILREFFSDYGHVGEMIRSSFSREEYFQVVELLRICASKYCMEEKDAAAIYRILNQRIALPVYHRVPTPKHLLDYDSVLCETEPEALLRRRYLSRQSTKKGVHDTDDLTEAMIMVMKILEDRKGECTRDIKQTLVSILREYHELEEEWRVRNEEVLEKITRDAPNKEITKIREQINALELKLKILQSRLARLSLVFLNATLEIDLNDDIYDTVVTFDKEISLVLVSRICENLTPPHQLFPQWLSKLEKTFLNRYEDLTQRVIAMKEIRNLLVFFAPIHHTNPLPIDGEDYLESVTELLFSKDVAIRDIATEVLCQLLLLDPSIKFPERCLTSLTMVRMFEPQEVYISSVLAKFLRKYYRKSTHNAIALSESFQIIFFLLRQVIQGNCKIAIGAISERPLETIIETTVPYLLNTFKLLSEKRGHYSHLKVAENELNPFFSFICTLLYEDRNNSYVDFLCKYLRSIERMSPEEVSVFKGLWTRRVIGKPEKFKTITSLLEAIMNTKGKPNEAKATHLEKVLNTHTQKQYTQAVFIGKMLKRWNVIEDQGADTRLERIVGGLNSQDEQSMDSLEYHSEGGARGKVVGKQKAMTETGGFRRRRYLDRN